MENNFEKTDRKFDWNQLLVWIFLAILEGTVSIVNFVNHNYLIGVQVAIAKKDAGKFGI